MLTDLILLVTSIIIKLKDQLTNDGRGDEVILSFMLSGVQDGSPPSESLEGEDAKQGEDLDVVRVSF